MKIVTIIGSPRGMKGSTGQLLQAFIDSAQSAGADVTSFAVDGRNVQPCVACDRCHRVGTCGQKDDFEKIRQAIDAADGIVVASPNYIFSVSAQLKAFIDRCCGPIHCQCFEGKYGAAIVTSGGPGSEEVEEYMLRFLKGLGCWSVGSVGCESWQLQVEQMRPAILARSAELGKAFVAAIANKQPFPEQAAERSAFMGRMQELVTMQKEAWPFEYEYWKSQGRP